MSDMIRATRPKSDQMNADDLIGGPRTIKITKVVIKDVPTQPISVFFEGDEGKPFKPCTTMGRVMMEVWNSNDSKTYVGKSMTLFRDPEAVYGGAKVGGVRISHMSDIPAAVTVLVTVSRGHKKPFTVKPLASAGAAATKTREPTPEEIDAGNTAAMNGKEAYKTWIKSLTAEQKEVLASRHADWIEVAKKADTPSETVAEMVERDPASIMSAG